MCCGSKNKANEIKKNENFLYSILQNLGFSFGLISIFLIDSAIPLYWIEVLAIWFEIPVDEPGVEIQSRLTLYVSPNGCVNQNRHYVVDDGEHRLDLDML